MMGLRPLPFDKSRADDEEYVEMYRAELERRLELTHPSNVAEDVVAALAGVAIFIALLLVLA